MSGKNTLRRHYKAVRNSIPSDKRVIADAKMYNSFIESEYFSSFSTFLVYVSCGSEVDTYAIIDFALKNKKRVAVPYCSDTNMFFYEIRSIDDLIDGAFGIPTVDISKATKITDFAGSLCVVPALAFDSNGNRLGYGGGYYDRFLSSQNIPTIGLCFEECIAEEIPTEIFDMKIDCILTEKQFRNSR